jgi:hypothetical protein
MLLYSLTIFLSAFLLFEVQPVIAKMILPWFGGSSAVWSTCMLFFQVVLLLGYLYAHGLTKLAPRRQAIVHSAVLAVTLISLPIIPNESWKHAGLAHPSMTILALLGITVGLPYFVLSSTSPLLQAWYARTHTGGIPYRLFALSNFASMLALLTYPFLVEPNLPSKTQAWVWSGAFICFAGICALTAWKTSQGKAVEVQAASADKPMEAPSFASRIIWLALAASASILLLAVTTHLTQDVAAIPFLWIIPLAIYLLTFIICFESPRLYYRPVFIPLFAASLVFMAYRLWPGHDRMEMRPIIALLSFALFNCCMVCHGELVRLKPHPRFLTGFYVTVSLGGAVGGLFVGMVAPNLFHAYYEFPIGLMVCGLTLAVVFAIAIWRGREGRIPIAAGLVALALVVLSTRYVLPISYPWWATISLMAACVGIAAAFGSANRAGKVAGIVALAGVVGLYGYWIQGIMAIMVDGYEVVVRNFYGQLRVYRDDDPRVVELASRRLIHGTINHGEQYLNEPYRRQPVTYFCPQSGIGRGMLAQEGEGAPRRIGVLGLGCGTLAAYARSGDTLRIYEINPQMLDIATHSFTYTTDTPAKVEYALGDGRLVLESEPDQHFDMLVMDAFSGDSVPVHLITREAFATYFRHLKPGGILAVNVTNTYLNLRPVMERAAAAFGKIAFVYDFEPGEDDQLCFTCSWTLIMDPATADQHPALKTNAKLLKSERPFRIWTDDFSNMFSILK